jgi:protein-glucosylgalactosylhydroxylysine glucosidase
MALVSRFAGEQPLRQIEAGAPAPYPLAGDVYPLAGDVAIDGVWLPDAPHQVRDLGAELRFLNGRVEQQIHLRGLSQCRPLRSANLRKPR